VFVTCGSARHERVTAAGTPASGWTTSGVTLPGSGFDDNAILADGNGGVVVFMRGSSVTALPIATRIDGNGALHAGWPAAGLGLSSVSHEAQDISIDSQLLASGPDHALAVWSLDAGSGTRRLMMQRLGLDGTVDPAWPADGLEVVAPDTLRACRALADGSGGAYIVRLSHGLPVATHVTATGVTLGGSDVELVDANAEYVPFLLGETGTPPATVPDDLAVDVTTDGGLLVGWNDARLAPAATFRLRWLTPSLAPAAGKPDTGLVFFPGSPHPPYTNLCAVHADGPDAAFLAWGDYHEVGPQVAGDLWMTRVQLPAPVGVPPAPRATALALSVPRPNPARASVVLDVTLPDDSPTRVELLDVAGRVVRTQLVQGAGAHPVSFGELGTLKPGLYFVRANGPAGSAATRVAVSR
jgi:hypothetical protein